jgi:hypothetical protein
VFDACRLALQFDTAARLHQGYERIRGMFAVRSVRNRFQHPGPLGWGDVTLVVEVRTPPLAIRAKGEGSEDVEIAPLLLPGSQGATAGHAADSADSHLAEIQLQLTSFVRAKTGAGLGANANGTSGGDTPGGSATAHAQYETVKEALLRVSESAVRCSSATQKQKKAAQMALLGHLMQAFVEAESRTL